MPGITVHITKVCHTELIKCCVLLLLSDLAVNMLACRKTCKLAYEYSRLLKV